MIVVSDTSPITSLMRVGELNLLFQLFGEIVIPVEVHSELLRKHSEVPKWIRVEAVQNVSLALAFRNVVDPGEAEAIQLAKELRADRILIDDYQARLLAEREGLQIVGLIGVVLIAKSKGIVLSARTVLTRLQSEGGFYISSDILEDALKTVGE
jgi:uncharacterized protein